MYNEPMRFAFFGLFALCGVIANAYDEVFVGDSGTRSVHRFRADTGAYLGAFTNPDLVNPWGIAATSSRVYVLDQLSSRLFAFDRATGVALGTVAHGLTFTYCVNVTSTGDILLGTTNGRAVRVSPAGALLGEYIQPVFTVSNKGVAQGSDSAIYTANFGDSRIQRFTFAGIPTAASSISTQSFVDAEGLQIANGIGYVAHSGAYKVSRFAVGNPPTWLGIWDLSATYNHFLFDVAPAPDGLAVWTCGIDWHGPSPVGRLVRHDPATGAVLGIYGEGILSTPKSVTVAAMPASARVEGTVQLQDWGPDESGAALTFEIRQGGSIIESETAVLGPGGAYSFQIEHFGNVDISVKDSHWLRSTALGIPISAGGTATQSFALINGDVDGDNEVGIGDYSQLSTAYGSFQGDANWNVEADLDGDEEVAISDYALLSANYGRLGDD